MAQRGVAMRTVVILLGPTGVGKTGAAILLAKELNTEIISADSMQVYRHMDIGTAKPAEQERAGVRHHMIDVVDPSEPYSVGRYIKDVAPAIEMLLSQGRIPLIVGGTGLYIRALTRGIFAGPSADAELRSRLLAMEEATRGALYASLLEVDPYAAEKIGKNNIRRLVRAIEVHIQCGSTISALQRELTSPLPYEFIKIGLTREREELYRMIDMRVDAMFREGLVSEVETLLGMNPDRTALQAIGYKEVVRYLNHEIDLQETMRLVKRNSRRYAKRQFTWFRQEEGIRWLDVTGLFEERDVAARILQCLKDSSPACHQSA